MADEPNQEELLKQQKANCIFCKIVSGEIPSKKVYEDEKMLAILDINPATKGHTLVLTKEHYPIMPLIPPDEFAHLFGKTAALSGAVAAGSLAPRCTTFIANGVIAGQQSPHFLFHLIPREDDDGLSSFEIPQKGVNQSDIAELIRTNLYAVMRQHLTKTGELSLLQVGQPVAEAEATAEPPITPPTPASVQPAPLIREAAEVSDASSRTPIPTLDQLAVIIDSNPEIKALLMNNPAKLRVILDKDPRLKALFGGLDLDELGARLKAQHLRTRPVGNQEDASLVEDVHPASANDLRPASSLTQQELFAFIDAKERLRQLILEDPDGLKRLIPGNERLARFFAGSDVDTIIAAYRAYAAKRADRRVSLEDTLGPLDEDPDAAEPSKEDDGPRDNKQADLDKISRLFR